jgi:hypothetical protein
LVVPGRQAATKTDSLTVEPLFEYWPLPSRIPGGGWVGLTGVPLQE